jgi:hypothetical protein
MFTLCSSILSVINLFNNRKQTKSSSASGTTYGNQRDHAALDAQERQAAAGRQRRNL